MRKLVAGTPLMVLGGSEHGPGLGPFRGLFGRSSVEIVMGHRQDRALVDPHAKTRALGQEGRAYAHDLALLDRARGNAIFRRGGLHHDQPATDRAPPPVGEFWPPDDDPECGGRCRLRDALIAASVTFSDDDLRALSGLNPAFPHVGKIGRV